MKAARRLFHRLTSWVTSARDEELLRAEFEEHIAMQTEENVRAGLSLIEARRQALLKFGSVEAIKESYRDQRRLPFIETVLSDTRHALRRMRKAPAFTAAVIVTLALGIGATTATFGVIDSILIRPLAYPQAEALVSVSHTVAGIPGIATAPCSPSMYFTYREENRIFEQFGVWSSRGASVTGVAEPEVSRALFVTYGALDAVVSGMFALRSNRAGTESLLAEAQQAIWSVNGRQPVFLVTVLETLYDQSRARTSFTLVMLAIAGVMGLMLGIVGIYGVIAYVVSQRIREIGIRTALGAQPAGLLRMFVRHGLRLVGTGAALGLVAAAGLTRLMSSLLFGVTALDPVTYTSVSALLIAAGVLASYLPARRAIAVDPIQALRTD
jgi:hypothetical protein